MRLSLLLFSSLLVFQALGQYPTTGNKQRLGYQTTGDGLVYRGNGSPAYTPSGINSAWAYIDTTAGTIYTYYAGSWHLVSAGGGGSFDGHVDSLVFNTAVTVVDSTAKMYWDANSETISVGVDGGAVYQMGEELYYPLVINKSGATIHNGQPVMVDTATLVTGDHVRIIPARNGATYPSEYVMGVATTDIPNDSTGLVTWFGYVREVKESDIAQTGVTIDAGDILYISSTEPGKYTNVRPSSPAHQSTVALVVRKPSVNNITLLVRPWLAPKLDNLSNVNVTSVTGLSVLRYNSTSGTWDASATPGIVAADTSAMLSYYLRKADTTAMLVPYQKDITLTTTGTSGAATFNGVTLNVPQYQAALTNPVTGTGTAGQVSYWNGTGTQAGSANLTFNTSTGTLQSGTTTGLAFNDPPIFAAKDQASETSIQVANTNAGGRSGIRLTSASDANVLIADFGQSNTVFPGQFIIEPNATLTNRHGIVISLPEIADTNKLTIYTKGRTEADRKFTFYANGNLLLKSGQHAVSPYRLDIQSTDAIRIPSGTTAQQPTGAAGVLRFNSDSTALEYHNGTSWRGIVNTWDAGTGGGGGSSVWSETADTVYLPAGKYVGIGTASPDQKLHIDGGAKMSKVILYSGVDTLELSNYAPSGSVGGNLVMGNGLLSSTSAAFGNIAIGLDALKNNTSGVVNTAIGANTLTDNTTGQQNLAIGAGNLYKNTTGRNNIAVGTNSAFLSANPFTGSYNTFIGGAVFRAAENASFNIGIGQSAGRDLVNGDGNITIGYNSMRSPGSSVSNNIAIGTSSLLAISGNLNLAIGVEAGYRITSGADLTSASGSIFIGNDTRASALANSNEIVIGGLARGQGSNTIMLGNSSITSLYCYDTSISSPSDERDKTDIDSLTIGLEFLKKLNPVAFTWNARDGGKVGQKDVGFIAQQAMPAQAAEAQGENLKLVEYKEDADQYYMQYANLIPVLVKAIKEQQAQIDALKIEIENLKNK